MTTALYIVVRKNGAEHTVCSEGPKPFIGTLARAKDVANFLKSVNPDETYEVRAVSVVKYLGVKTDRYSATEEAPSNATKRTRKTPQKRS